MTEVWKPTHIYPTHYRVSNLGNVKRIMPGRGAKIHGNLKPFLNCNNKSGHYRVRLVKNAIEKDCYVHVLVARAFLGNPKKGYECNHIDANNRNNILKNLEYITHKENIRHAFRNGLFPSRKGSKHPSAKLTDHQVHIIREMYSSGYYFQHEIAKIFNMSQPHIQHITSRKSWSHI